MPTATETRNAIYDLGERFGWECLAVEMLNRMSGDDAADFLEHMQDNYLDDEEEEEEPDCDDSDDGYALASAGWGTDEDYGG